MSTAVSTAMAGVEVTAILGAVNVIATYFAFRWIDKAGRRPLARKWLRPHASAVSRGRYDFRAGQVGISGDKET